jgi:hypothetical protein
MVFKATAGCFAGLRFASSQLVAARVALAAALLAVDAPSDAVLAAGACAGGALASTYIKGFRFPS